LAVKSLVVIDVIDRVVFETSSVRVGAFRCPTDHPSFHDSGPIRGHCFVFPRTPVVIQHKDDRPFAADSTLVTLYNRGQEYRRERVSPDGDRCDWYAVSDEVLRDALADRDPQAADDCRRPIRFAFARTSADTYLLQRQLFTRVSQAAPPDPLFVEETVFALLERVINHAYGDKSIVGARRVSRRSALLAHAACEVLGRCFAEPLTLAQIADSIGTSPFHLCRSFRRATGMTMHDYRNQLRLRSTLDALENPQTDLSQLALAAGYSSHSHFTASFRRAFGITPSIVRKSIRGEFENL
jgi:AraC-like DNA-binding protein